MINIEHYKNRIISIGVQKGNMVIVDVKGIEKILGELVKDIESESKFQLSEVDEASNDIWESIWNPENQLIDDDDRIALIRKRIRKMFKKLK